MFSTVMAPVCIPTTVHEGSFLSMFSHLLTPVVPCVFDFSYFDKCEVITHCDFDLHFPGE